MSTYVTGLLLRTPIPGADPAHKLILMVLGEALALDEHPDFEELARIAQMSRATAYRKVADLTHATLLQRHERWEGKVKSYRWEIAVEQLRCLHGDRGDGPKERAENRVRDGFKRQSQSENSQSEKLSQPEKTKAAQDFSQSETGRHNSQIENSQIEKDQAPQGESQSATAPSFLSSSSHPIDARERLHAITAVAGPWLADPSKDGGLLLSIGYVDRWLRQGATWDEILIAITGRTMTPPRNSKPINSFKYFDGAVTDQVALRLAEATPIEPAKPGEPHGRTARAGKRSIDVDAAFERAQHAADRIEGGGRPDA
jgi:hypothetical protein